MTDRRFFHILLVGAAAALLGAVVIGAGLPDLMTQARPPVNSVRDSTTEASYSLINRALHTVPPAVFFDYTVGFENPFRQWSAVGEKKKTVASAAPPRNRLLLKGILTTNKPLAILEDPMGATYIRGIGDTADDQQVIAISGNRVSIRDRHGVYVLAVEEE